MFAETIVASGLLGILLIVVLILAAIFLIRRL